MHRISGFETRESYFVPATATVREAVKTMCEHRVGAIAVCEGEAVKGIFSERDLMKRVVNEGLDPDTVTVGSLMSPKLVYIHQNEDVMIAKALMQMNRVRHLVVLGENNEFRGLVSMRDLIDVDMIDASQVIHEMNDRYYEGKHEPLEPPYVKRVIKSFTQTPKDMKAPSV